jgi:hypothetical protein
LEFSGATNHNVGSETDSGATNHNVGSETDVEGHVAELQSQWAKPNRSSTHLKLRLCHGTLGKTRVELLTRTPSGSILPIFKRYPCFTDSCYVLYEFALMMGNERVVQVAKNMKKLLFAVEAIADLSHEDPLRIMPVVQFLEKVKFHQGGKSSTKPKSVVQMKEDIANSEIQKALEFKD